MKGSDKIAKKKLKEKAKTAKRNSGRRPPIPPNKVVPDKKKKESKKAARTKVEVNNNLLCRPDGGRDGSGHLM